MTPFTWAVRVCLPCLQVSPGSPGASCGWDTGHMVGTQPFFVEGRRREEGGGVAFGRRENECAGVEWKRPASRTQTSLEPHGSQSSSQPGLPPSLATHSVSQALSDTCFRPCCCLPSTCTPLAWFQSPRQPRQGLPSCPPSF